MLSSFFSLRHFSLCYQECDFITFMSSFQTKPDIICDVVSFLKLFFISKIIYFVTTLYRWGPFISCCHFKSDILSFVISFVKLFHLCRSFATSYVASYILVDHIFIQLTMISTTYSVCMRKRENFLPWTEKNQHLFSVFPWF